MSWKNGFVDLQVNGYMGVDFNGDATPEDIRDACVALGKHGVDGILATVITDHEDVMTRRLGTLVEACEQDELVRKLVMGIHIEGPFINETPGYVGAHPVPAVREADVDMAKRLLAAAGDLTRIVTLAPERDPGFRVTRFLADQGVVVSAGHCDPELEQLQGATDAGLSMFTHLGNGCAAEMHRHDNVVQRAISLAEHLWFGFIADGVHVPYFALKNYLRAVGVERSFFVTDAILAAGLGPGEYEMAGNTVVVDELGVTRYPGDLTHFVGSASTMPLMAERTQRELGLDDATLQQLMCDNPRRALGLSV